MVPARGTNPVEGAALVLRDGPCRGVLQSVVPAAEVRKVRTGSGAAVRGVNCVVNIATRQGLL